MITTVLFDLDGTLLPMDQEVFVNDYLGRMAKYLVPHGYDPDLLIKALWTGTRAMVKNDGAALNEDVFWNVFNRLLGKDARKDEALFDAFYRGEFQKAKESCGFHPAAAGTVQALKAMGYHPSMFIGKDDVALEVLSFLEHGWNGENFREVTENRERRFCRRQKENYMRRRGL